ncbi:MAG: arylsulfatase A-like enzyme [Psychromonas sp.]|jgi:arylsulfatase A-like enzyme
MKKMLKYSTLLSVTVLFALFSLSATSAEEKPNILLIMADDLGFSDIGAYGSEVATPNLDLLAKKGMRFNQFRNTSKCFTTRASLLTGQYQQNVGMSKSPAHITNAVTLGDVLRTAGYKTLMVGKHHGKDNPYDMGFDRYYGLRDGASNHFNPGVQRAGEAKPAQKSGQYKRRAFCFDSKCLQPYTPSSKSYYSSDTFTDWALEMLNDHEQQADQQPFFMYLSYTAPHDPIQAWPKDIAKYKGKYDEGYQAIAKARYKKQLKLGIIDKDTHPQTKPIHQAWDSLSAAEKQNQSRVMEVYAAMIDNMDQNIGRVIKQLEASGEIDNTLIIFLSDNGASAEIVEIGDGEIGNIDRWTSIGGHWANVANVPFRAFKNTSFEGGVLTPFIVKWPGVVPTGMPTNETPAHLVDIMATFIDITGATYPSKSAESSLEEPVGEMVGNSLLNSFKFGTQKQTKPHFFDWKNGQAVVDGNWKLVRWKAGKKEQWAHISTGEWELFDLSKDRTENNNMASIETDKLNQMIAKYDHWWNKTLININDK